jgi:hypothetical protein
VKQQDVRAFFAWAKREKDQTYAHQGYIGLYALLAVIDHCWPSSGLLAIHTRYRESITEFFGRERGLRSLAATLFERYGTTLESSEVVNAPTTLLDFAALTSFLLEDYPIAVPAEASAAVEAILRGLLPRIVDDALESVRPQTERLADVLWQIVSFLEERGTLARLRVVVLELPIGNSIPSKLLEGLLRERGHDVHLVRVALARNTATGDGLTRQQLLEQELSAFGMRQGDCVVLVDEWLSGANFKGVTDHVRKLCAARGASLLPVALLTEDSPADERFTSHCRHHDKLLLALGEGGERWRVVFPRIISVVEREGYFFWSEYDRMAGYRKMQVLGSFLSMLDAAIEDLHRDRSALLRVRNDLLGDVAQQLEAGQTGPDLTPAVTNDKHSFVALFEHAYQAYLGCREELQRIELPTNYGETEDIEAEVAAVNARLWEVVRERDAQYAVWCAVNHLEASHDMDLADPYPFSTHAAVVVDLEGGLRLFHDMVMRHLADVVRRRAPV